MQYQTPLLVKKVLLGLWSLLGLQAGAEHLWGNSFNSFVSGIIRSPKTVGAATPCTRYVAEEFIKPLRDLEGPRRILEVGAGTGALTQHIVTQLRTEDQFDVVELQGEYCQVLEQYRRDNVAIHCMSITDFEAEPYDAIICTLPFTSLDTHLVTAILEKFKHLIKPGGMISYIEYIGIATIKEKVLFGDEHAQFIQKRAILQELRDEHTTETVSVIGNIPPAYVHHISINS